MYLGDGLLLICLFLVFRLCRKWQPMHNDLLLAAPLFVVIVAETTIVAILTPTLGVEATAAALPSKVTKRTQRW